MAPGRPARPAAPEATERPPPPDLGRPPGGAAVERQGREDRVAARAAAASSSSSSSGEDADRPAKRRKLPAASGLFGPGARRGEDPAAHQGRTRRVAHVDGNYATSVYLPVPATAAWRRCAEACAAELRALVASDPGSLGREVHVVDADKGLGWHVTISPLLMLRRHLISPLLQKLEALAANAPASPVFFESHVDVFVSQAGDRFFAAVPVADTSAAWLRRAAADVLGIAESLALMQKAPDVQQMRLHCSLAWTLGDPRPGLEAAGAERCETAWGTSWRLGGGLRGEALRSPGRALHVRVGERDSAFPLRSATGLGGLLGAGAETSSDEDSG